MTEPMSRYDYYTAIHQATARKNKFTLGKHGEILWRGSRPPDVWVEGPSLLSHEDDRRISDAANNRPGCDRVVRDALLAACRIRRYAGEMTPGS